ncbi:ferredoxin reductase [Microbacteriaceae bacterium VKM Ac-2855]|nr:ferredoxin reductase [Microbacteriaceae bacterium VKM Ac-2855]
MGGWLEAEVRSVIDTTSHGRVLSLDVPGWPGNLPGQHLDVRLTAEDGYQAVRSYSIASFGPGTRVELAVDELPDGEVSPYLVRDVLPGDALEVKGPLGGYFVWRPEDIGPVQLVAGGSGVVPLVAIARAHRSAQSSAPFRMLYSVRSVDDAFYAQELTDLTDERFRLDWVYTRTAPPGSSRPAGRVDGALLEALTLAPSEHPLVYVCGPTGFVEAVAAALVTLGHAPERIKTERFGGA